MNSGYFKWIPTYIDDNIWLNPTLNDKFFWLNWRENQNTDYIFIKIPPPHTSHQKSYLFWGNVQKRGTAGEATDDSIIRRMRYICWINRATNTHSEYVTLMAFPGQQLLRASPPVSRTFPVSLQRTFNSILPCVRALFLRLAANIHIHYTQTTWPTYSLVHIH